MIIFKTIRYKNILSTGNAWTEISLDKNNTTLIVGENGAGKSTILDALAFALYGKPFRGINKPQLVNSINNKDTLVEVEFVIGKHQFMIRRGIKPDIFEIFKDGELLSQNASVRDYQENLETNILKMNFKSFGQIVVLGSSTFVPFMQLPAGIRREIIEDLLDIQIFSTMNLILKDKIVKNKEEITEVKHKIDLTSDRITNARQHNKEIKDLKSQQISKIESDIEETQAKIRVSADEVISIEKEMNAFLAQTEPLPNSIKKQKELLKIKDSIDSKICRLEKDISFYQDTDNCPTCLQVMDSSHKEKHILEKETKKKEVAEAIPQLEEKLKSIEEEISIYNECIQNADKKKMEALDIKASMKVQIGYVEKMKNNLKAIESSIEEIDSSNILSLEKELNEYNDNHSILLEDREIMSVAANLLKDGGIKTQIIRQYIPIINKLINKYLAEMDFFVQFELDEQFKETLKSRFRDQFSYSSFSEGEKMRIDLALLFTWRAVSKLRNSTSTNLLIMDEVFDGSLDVNGMEEFMKIIRSITGDSNIFVISHKTDQLVDRFDSVLRFEKVKNFSRIAS